MGTVRIVARLDIKGSNLIKGIHLEGLRVLGKPYNFAKKYYDMGVDELLYLDSVASLYGRNNLTELIRETAKDIFIPLTVGGGIRSLEDVREILRAGADKVAINTAAIKNPKLISEIAEQFGSQCMVLSIEAKRRTGGDWECFIDNGREHTGLDVIEWAKAGEKLGAGEILLTSVDQEGTRKGFDIDLVKRVSDSVAIPIVASGGMGSATDFISVVKVAGASAVAIADGFHYQRVSLQDLKELAAVEKIPVRQTL